MGLGLAVTVTLTRTLASFDDFLDTRVRAVRPSVRRLLLRATMPVTLGLSWDEAVKLVESEALASVGVKKIGDPHPTPEPHPRP